MTAIGDITIAPSAYSKTDYSVSMKGLLTNAVIFNELKELFAKATYGTAIHAITGDRPHGEDLTEGSKNTQFVQFTHGTTGKPIDGFYLLRPSYFYSDDESPEGHSYIFNLNLFFLGTEGFYSFGAKVRDLDEVSNDWGI